MMSHLLYGFRGFPLLGIRSYAGVYWRGLRIEELKIIIFESIILFYLENGRGQEDKEINYKENTAEAKKTNEVSRHIRPRKSPSSITTANVFKGYQVPAFRRFR